jgi:hypothetical protein
METFKERLYTELKDLQDKIEKLDDFIDHEKFKVISPIQQSLLLIQLKGMRTYEACLEQRINNL